MMKKNKPTIHLSGINILLKLLMYKDFHHYNFKYYIVTNKYEEKNNYYNYSKKIEYQKKIISALKKKFNINIDILENLIEANVYLVNQEKKNDYLINSEVLIEDNDIISNNLNIYLARYIKGKKISFYSEGFGIFKIGSQKNFINISKKNLILMIKFFLSKLSFMCYPEEIIIIPDPNNWFHKYLKYYSLPYAKTTLMKNISNENFIENYFDIFESLSDKFSVYYHSDYEIIYPLLKRLNLEENSKVLNDILNITKGNILVKQHPSDYRDFSILLKISKRIILLNDELNLFPGELFIKNKTKYYGEFSTLALSVHEDIIKYMSSKSLEYREWAKNYFKNFNNIITKNL